MAFQYCVLAQALNLSLQLSPGVVLKRAHESKQVPPSSPRELLSNNAVRKGDGTIP